MLSELVVSDLGVIEHGTVLLGQGMTALTGETGAGKTLVVEAISLLLGGRAEAHLVRTGCEEARVDGRFERDVDGAHVEVVLSRVIPRSGRSRAYVDGRPVPVSVLTELGLTLVDLHGQHAHQSLLSSAAQRAALDAFGGVDLLGLHGARARTRALLDEQAGIGGDERTRAREIDLLRFQLREIEDARIERPDEEAVLAALEDVLADASAHRDAGAAAADALAGDGGAGESVGQALRVLGSRAPFAPTIGRLRSVTAELRDVADEIRAIAERIDDDPARLDATRRRRQKLRELQRKYGDDLDAVLRFHAEATQRLEELTGHERRAAVIQREIDDAKKAEHAAFAAVVTERTAAAARLGAEIERRLQALAMPSARVHIEVDPDLPEHGDGAVTFLLAANPGADPLPLTKVASGGELARIMLALRLALLDGRSLVSGDPPDTLLFDEVDAGIGGTAAVAVGEALAAMSSGRQVLVVTHLPQVAACADHHVRVRKHVTGGATRTEVARLDAEERVTELARMLSGSPDSPTARRHAEELMAAHASAAAPTGTAAPTTSTATRSRRPKPTVAAPATPTPDPSTPAPPRARPIRRRA